SAPPAFATRTSHVGRAEANSSTCFLSVTSSPLTWALPPESAIRAATSSRRPSLRAASTTWYPSRASRSAAAAPIPLPAPVTTAVRMGCILPGAKRGLHFPTPGSPASSATVPGDRPRSGAAWSVSGSPTIGNVAESVPAPRAVIFDWGGVITSPILDTVSAWLAAERIDRESYAAAMRPWVQRAYGGDEAESAIHALGRRGGRDADVHA